MSPPKTNDHFFHIFYRAINKINDDPDLSGPIRQFIYKIIYDGVNFLLKDALRIERSREYDDIEKLFILKSLCVISESGIIEKDKVENLKYQLSKIGVQDLQTNNRNLNVQILLAYAKIPGHPNERIRVLNAIFRNHSYSEIAKEVQGEAALLTFAKIPILKYEDRMAALNAILEKCNNNFNEVTRYYKKGKDITYLCQDSGMSRHTNKSS